MQVRPCEMLDLPQMMTIIGSYDAMYGTPLGMARDTLMERVTMILHNNGSQECLIGCYSDKGLIGFCTQFFYGQVPYWRVSNLFIDKSCPTSQIMQIGGLLFEFLLQRAEEAGRYEFYYVVRDHRQDRLQMTIQLVPKLKDRYYITDVYVVQPKEVPPYKFYRDLLGFMCGENLKTVVIRQGWMHPDYRRSVWSAT